MLSELNQEQKEAVTTTEGPLLVLAGAGTGKTKVLTTRLAYIINEGKARPFECLAVTFTNKAAREMRERLENLISGENAADVWMGTFHGICLRILRVNAEKLGYAKNFVVYGEDDSEKLIKEILNGDDRYQPKTIMNIISRWKDQALTWDKVPDNYNSDLPTEARKIYETYQKRLREMNAMDFGDLILNTLTLLQTDTATATKYQNKFRYIMVDEYQDTNIAQYLWLKLLSMGHNNIACVGDDDQSIYAWRGAEIANILRFEQDFAGAKIIRLESNYRSTQHILACASRLIAHNSQRLGKDLKVAPNINGNGEKVVIRGVFNDRAEADFVANTIRNALNNGMNGGKIAVLVRASFMTRLFEEAFLIRAIKYRITGGLRFYERKEVMDIIAYIRLLLNRNDDMAFSRIINTPRRGFGNTALNNIRQYAYDKGCSFFEALTEMTSNDILKKAAKKTAEDFVNMFAEWRQRLDTDDHCELLKKMLTDIDYVAKMKLDREREENVSEVVKSLSDFRTMENLMEHVSLDFGAEEADTMTGCVSIMTLHAAKGLEFDCVFLPGWEDGLFPSSKTMDESPDGLEEERRLAYVGITRGRRNVIISFAANRKVYDQWMRSQPSRFLSELPKNNIKLWLDRGIVLTERLYE